MGLACSFFSTVHVLSIRVGPPSQNSWRTFTLIPTGVLCETVVSKMFEMTVQGSAFFKGGFNVLY